MCQPTNLSADGPFRVDLCTCGQLHLHIGPVTLRVTAAAFPQLTDVIELACARLPAMQRAQAESERFGHDS